MPERRWAVVSQHLQKAIAGNQFAANGSSLSLSHAQLLAGKLDREAGLQAPLAHLQQQYKQTVVPAAVAPPVGRGLCSRSPG